MVLCGLRAVHRLGMGLQVATPLSREDDEGLPESSVRRVRLEPREDPTVVATAPIVSLLGVIRESCFETSARWGVWLGRHICYTTTQVS